MAVGTHTYTRVHEKTVFANPYLRCDECGGSVPAWHNNTTCGCHAGFWSEPCKHNAGLTSECPSWSPVNGCSCPAGTHPLPPL